MNKNPNHLINSKSPYLLQHAYNPVDWYPWGEEALGKAKAENKPILVSIGYSACHWCHVMEKESFEDEEVAASMNKYFVCIKIDREERPDLDNIYMEALQVMGLQGGWPLNVFLMPNHKPFYGGTYFPKKNWKQLLGSIAEAYQKHFDQLNESAEGLGRSIGRDVIEKYGLQKDESNLTKEELSRIVHSLVQEFDWEWGGQKRVPKFPMPAVWSFLLDYAQLSNNEPVKEKVKFTLQKIGMGGIYDHVGGGFARYSVDGKWFVPHFEKMLYDNGQLLSLYAKAYQLSREGLFREKINETVEWLQREMLQEEGGFYAALDADSEGVEGKFYTWTDRELEDLLGEDKKWFAALYTIKESGNWESGHNILFQTRGYEDVAKEFGLTVESISEKLNEIKSQLLQYRDKRIKPGLDDKIISGWNGLVLSGLVQAYHATGNAQALELAQKNGQFLLSKMSRKNELFRSYKHGSAYTPAFLEDYAAVIQAFMDLYQVTFEAQWIHKAKELAEYTLDHFFDKNDGLFYFNNPDAEVLIVNKKEIFDNVIPSSNSMMARNLHRLGLFFYEDNFREISRNMLKTIRKLLSQEPGFLSNWASLYLEQLVPTAEIGIIGRNSVLKGKELQQAYHPNIVIAASAEETAEVPLLMHKQPQSNGDALIYVCYNRACRQPVTDITKAEKELPDLL